MPNNTLLVSSNPQIHFFQCQEAKTRYFACWGHSQMMSREWSKMLTRGRWYKTQKISWHHVSKPPISFNTKSVIMLLTHVFRTYLEPVLCVFAKPILTLGKLQLMLLNELFPIWWSCTERMILSLSLEKLSKVKRTINVTRPRIVHLFWLQNLILNGRWFPSDWSFSVH